MTMDERGSETLVQYVLLLQTTRRETGGEWSSNTHWEKANLHVGLSAMSWRCMGGAEVVSTRDGRFTLLIQHASSTGVWVALGVKQDVVTSAEIPNLQRNRTQVMKHTFMLNYKRSKRLRSNRLPLTSAVLRTG